MTEFEETCSDFDMRAKVVGRTGGTGGTLLYIKRDWATEKRDVAGASERRPWSCMQEEIQTAERKYQGG